MREREREAPETGSLLRKLVGEIILVIWDE